MARRHNSSELLHPATHYRKGETRSRNADFLPYADCETTSPISAKAGVCLAEAEGFSPHTRHPSRRMLVIPVHKGDIPRGLFLKILKDAGFTEDDFLKG